MDSAKLLNETKDMQMISSFSNKFTREKFRQRWNEIDDCIEGKFCMVSEPVIKKSENDEEVIITKNADEETVWIVRKLFVRTVYALYRKSTLLNRDDEELHNDCPNEKESNEMKNELPLLSTFKSCTSTSLCKEEQHKSDSQQPNLSVDKATYNSTSSSLKSCLRYKTQNPWDCSCRKLDNEKDEDGGFKHSKCSPYMLPHKYQKKGDAFKHVGFSDWEDEPCNSKFSKPKLRSNLEQMKDDLDDEYLYDFNLEKDFSCLNISWDELRKKCMGENRDGLLNLDINDEYKF